jgi:N-acetylglucosaminyl-diphospho-decaprenol L-rhamnosyltransferase
MNPKKILIVDDEPVSLHALSMYLRELGYAFVAAANGAEAWEILQQAPNDFFLVIADRIMPKLHGTELLMKMRADDALKNIPMVMLTGVADKTEMIEAVKLGASDFLYKPLEKDLLLAVIKKFSIDISILIINYNTASLIPTCVNSILQQQGVQCEIIVVDNASADNSAEVLQSLGNQIIPILNKDNLGFGKANNQAAKQAQGRYLFLLNPDANLQSPNGLRELIAFMETNPNYGLVGPKIISKDRDHVSLPAKNYPGQKYSAFKFEKLPGEIAWVLGAGMLIRRDLYNQIGGFDEDYFLYGEDADICLRIRQQGYAIGYCENVIVEHIGGGSEKRTPTEQLWRKKLNGAQLFYKKHYPREVARGIVKNKARRAYWRYLLLKIKQKLMPLSAREAGKYLRYKTVYETSKEFLMAP